VFSFAYINKMSTMRFLSWLDWKNSILGYLVWTNKNKCINQAISVALLTPVEAYPSI